MENKKLAGDKLIVARVPYDLWKSIRQLSLDEEISVNTIIKNLLISYRDKRKRVLTNRDNMIK